MKYCEYCGAMLEDDAQCTCPGAQQAQGFAGQQPGDYQQGGYQQPCDYQQGGYQQPGGYQPGGYQQNSQQREEAQRKMAEAQKKAKDAAK